MEKTIVIDGRPIKFKATAAIPRLYRIKFKRDLFEDMRQIQGAMERSDEGSLPVSALTIFENVAFMMAKHGDKDAVPDSVEEWLDSLNMLSIYQVFPELSELWTDNIETQAEAKKK